MIDRPFFFSSVRDALFDGVLSQSQVDGLNAILDAWEKWVPNPDLRCIAYSLGTVYLETARTMQPIREWGEGKGHAYGLPTGPWHGVYYGRGDVQLTFIANYAKATHELKILNVLGPDDDLVKTPDLALRPDIAAAILVLGMSRGWFTGKKLSDYFGATPDWYNARRIINGTDQAWQIGEDAKKFYAALEPDDPKKEP